MSDQQHHRTDRVEKHSPPVPTPMTEREASRPGEYPMADPSGDTPVEPAEAPSPEKVLGRPEES